MSSMNIVGYNTQPMSVERINGKVWGAILLLIPIFLFALEMRGIAKGMQKQDDILRARYASER